MIEQPRNTNEEMKLIITEDYILWYFGELIRHVASKLKVVSDPEYYSPYELGEMLDPVDHPLVNKLLAFLTAYREWHNFQVKCHVEQLVPSKDIQLKTELDRLTIARNESRRVFTEAMNAH